MLMGIPRVLTPDLLAAMMEMGHGDELVIADANFPAASVARDAGARLLRADSAGGAALMDAILTFLPLDAADSPVRAMVGPEGSSAIHAEYGAILERHGYARDRMIHILKADFYARAGSAFAVVASGEPARFANLIIRKGVVK